MFHGDQTVATAGTDVQLVTSSVPVEARGLKIQADSTNTGAVYIGVGSASAASHGVALSPGTTAYFGGANTSSIDLANIFIDAATNGNKVRYFAEV
jgi:hypothetical protein